MNEALDEQARIFSRLKNALPFAMGGLEEVRADADRPVLDSILFAIAKVIHSELEFVEKRLREINKNA